MHDYHRVSQSKINFMKSLRFTWEALSLFPFQVLIPLLPLAAVSICLAQWWKYGGPAARDVQEFHLRCLFNCSTRSGKDHNLVVEHPRSLVQSSASPRVGQSLWTILSYMDQWSVQWSFVWFTLPRLISRLYHTNPTVFALFWILWYTSWLRKHVKYVFKNVCLL